MLCWLMGAACKTGIILYTCACSYVFTHLDSVACLWYGDFHWIWHNILFVRRPISTSLQAVVYIPMYPDIEATYAM